MDFEYIVSTANNFLVDEFEVDRDEIAPDAPLKETLGLDSLDYIDLVVVIEQNFGVKLGESDFKSMKTFQDFYSTIQQKMQEKDGK